MLSEKDVHDEVVVRDVVLEEIYQEVEKIPPAPPPPPHLLPSPTTFAEWFYRFCETERPGAISIRYYLGFSRSDQYDAIDIAPTSLEIVNGSNPSEKDVPGETRFYTILKSEFGGLEFPEYLKKMKTQFRKLSRTERFKRSSLAAAKQILIRFDDNGELRLK